MSLGFAGVLGAPRGSAGTDAVCSDAVMKSADLTAKVQIPAPGFPLCGCESCFRLVKAEHARNQSQIRRLAKLQCSPRSVSQVPTESCHGGVCSSHVHCVAPGCSECQHPGWPALLFPNLGKRCFMIISKSHQCPASSHRCRRVMPWRLRSLQMSLETSAVPHHRATLSPSRDSLAPPRSPLCRATAFQPVLP